jgi:hypothetical protein
MYDNKIMRETLAIKVDRDDEYEENSFVVIIGMSIAKRVKKIDFFVI